MSNICETINNSYKEKKAKKSDIKYYLKNYKKECRENGCYFHNATALCVTKDSTKQYIYDLLEKSRDLDFARTFATEENLKSLKYRLEMRKRLINKQISISKNPDRNPYDMIDRFILDNPPCDFIDVVKKATHLGSGGYGHAFQLCPEENCQPEFVMKLINYGAYDKYDDKTDYNNLPITNKLRGENVEVLQPAYLEKMLIKNKDTIVSPHISLPIMAFRCNYSNPSISKLMKLVESKKRRAFKKTERIYKEDGPSITNPNNDILVYISEYAKGGDLAGWLEANNPKEHDLSILLFQLFYTYACIQINDPSFRHNDLSLNNVLVQEIEIPDGYDGHYYHYQFRDSHYLIPITTFSVRLWDMDFSNSDTVPNRKVFCGPSQNKPEYGLNPNQRCTSDINSFETYGILNTNCLQSDLFYCMYWIRLFSSYYRNTLVEGDVKDFIRSWTNISTISTAISSSKLISEIRLNQASHFLLEEDIDKLNKYKQAYSSRYAEFMNRAVYQELKNLPDSQSSIKPSIWTTYHSENHNINIPYAAYTAAHCLLHCNIFTKFIVSESDLQDKLDNGLILANYVLS